MSEGVKAMFSALRQQQSPVEKTSSGNLNDKFEIEDRKKMDQCDGEIRVGNRTPDYSTKKNGGIGTAKTEIELVRQGQKTNSCSETKPNSERKKTRRVVSESALQNKVRYFMHHFLLVMILYDVWIRGGARNFSTGGDSSDEGAIAPRPPLAPTLVWISYKNGIDKIGQTSKF